MPRSKSYRKIQGALRVVDALEPRRLLCMIPHGFIPPEEMPEPSYKEFTPLADNPTIGRADGAEGAGADIVWVNRLFGDNFAAQYGANEVIARTLVDRAIADWERVIQDFNYASGVTFNLTLLADPGFPGVGFITNVEDGTGKPDAGEVHLDNDGGGIGWYFDPTPGTSIVPDDSEFEDFIARHKGDDGPVDDLDFYMVALHEIGHVLGVASRDSDPNNVTPLAVNNFITPNTWLIDPNNPGDGILPPNAPNRPDPGNALYPVNIGGGPVEYTMTNAGSGDYPNLSAAHIYEGPAVGGWPAHPHDLLNDGRTLNGNVDVRQLIGDATTGFLRDVYGYTVTMPSQINTFHANFNTTTGLLRVWGDPAAESFVQIDTVGNDLRVRVDGTSELIPYSLIDNIIISTGPFDDIVNLDAIPSGMIVQVSTGQGADVLNVGAGDLDSTILSPITWNQAGAGEDALRVWDQDDTGNDEYRVTNLQILKPNTLFGGITYNFDAEMIVLTANDSTNLITVRSLYVDKLLTVNGRDGDDTIRVGEDLGIGEVLGVDGDVNANGNLGNDLVIFDDSGGAGEDIYLVNVGLYQQTDAEIMSFQAERVEVRGNDENNGFGVFATGATTLNLIGNEGDDQFVLSAGDLDAQITSNVTVSGGLGIDRVNFFDETAAASTSLTVDADATGDFVDLTSGDRVRVFSVGEMIFTGSPLNDTFITIGMVQPVRLNGNNGNDTFDVRGHPTMNSALLPRVTVSSGAGSDTLLINNDGAGGARAVFEADDSLNNLNIAAGGNLRLAEGDLLLEVVNSATLPVSGFVLDLTDGSYVRRGNVSAPYYRTRLEAGYAAGAWNGQGIQSSTAASSAISDGVGYARGDALFNGVGGIVDGINLAAGDLLARYTLNGDTDLDRDVDFNDLLRVAQNYGLTPRDWWQGNFTYDNTIVDFNDLLPLAQNYGESLGFARIAPRIGASSRTILMSYEEDRLWR